MNDAAFLFPIGTDFLGVVRYFQSVADGKCGAGLLDHLLRFFQWIDGKGNDVGVLLLECFDVRLVVGDLPDTIGSPDAAIEQDDCVFSFEIGGNT